MVFITPSVPFARKADNIYDIAEGIDRWSVQKYFDKNYRDLEPDYIQEAISASLKRIK